MCNIQGECFAVFSRDPRFARAYLVYQILHNYVYTNTYPYSLDKDPVAHWLQKDAQHHNIAHVMRDGPGLTLQDIARIHVRACKKEKLSAFERIEIVLQMSGASFHYDHKFNELSKMVTDNKLCTKFEVTKLKVMFEKCKKEHDEQEKQSQKDYKSDPTDIYLYGAD